jgi:hypothetical protein
MRECNTGIQGLHSRRIPHFGGGVERRRGMGDKPLISCSEAGTTHGAAHRGEVKDGVYAETVLRSSVDRLGPTHDLGCHSFACLRKCLKRSHSRKCADSRRLPRCISFYGNCYFDTRNQIAAFADV